MEGTETRRTSTIEAVMGIQEEVAQEISTRTTTDADGRLAAAQTKDASTNTRTVAESVGTTQTVPEEAVLEEANSEYTYMYLSVKLNL